MVGQGLCNLLVKVVPRQPDILWIDDCASVSGESLHRVLRITALTYAVVQCISETPVRGFQLRIGVLQNCGPQWRIRPAIVEPTCTVMRNIGVDIVLRDRDVPPLLAIPQRDIEISRRRVVVYAILYPLWIRIGDCTHCGIQIAVSNAVLIDIVSSRIVRIQIFVSPPRRRFIIAFSILALRR
ncbi:hypothetical protein MMUC44124_05055 [Mycolicibacterium mucogenicum DSM 44124]|nr:hypothetical protein MMUC44124_05055 [Mycolicibacterium mucogenicum DSM 44124]